MVIQIRSGFATPIAILLAIAIATVPAVAEAAPTGEEIGIEEREAGLWYADRLGFDEIASQGLDGQGTTIAVIDDAINLSVPELAGADIEVRGQFCKLRSSDQELPAETDDTARYHGTNVVSMLVGNGRAADGGLGTRGIVPKAKVLFYAVDSTSNSEGERQCEAYNPVTEQFEADRKVVDGGDLADARISLPAALAARQALADGADVVSVSLGTSAWEADSWVAAQVSAMRAGVPLVAATPNPGETGGIDVVMPASINGVVAVGGVDKDANVVSSIDEAGVTHRALGAGNLSVAAPGAGILVPSSNAGWSQSLGSGVSLATPLVSGMIALGLQKYPEASAYQVLQSMIRTTGGGEPTEPAWQDAYYGYGIAKPVAMLAIDPTQYPDENPLFITSIEDPRCNATGKSQNEDSPLALEGCAWPGSPTLWQVENASVTESAPDAAPNEETNSISVMALTIGIVIVVVLVSLGVALLILRNRRKRAKSDKPNLNGIGGYGG